MSDALCRHCKTRKACRPRGLCCRCYDSVREQYPSTSKFAPYCSRPPSEPIPADHHGLHYIVGTRPNGDRFVVDQRHSLQRAERVLRRYQALADEQGITLSIESCQCPDTAWERGRRLKAMAHQEA